MMNKLQIVLKNAIRCGGMCSYCSVASQEAYINGVNSNDLINSLKKVDDESYNLIEFDFDALEKAIANHSAFKGDSIQLSIWGADPINSFQAFQEVYDFGEYLGEKYGKKVLFSTSTNGLAFARDDVTEWLLNHNVSMQLSHDGLGQWFRTRDIEPLNFSQTKELVKAKKLRSINAVLNFWNADCIANYEYIKSSKIPYIRIYNARQEIYDIKSVNAKGLLNGKEYQELKLKPIGPDITIRNDWKLAEEYNLPQLAHQADLWFDTMEYMYDHIKLFPECQSSLLDRVSRNKRKNPYLKGPLCVLYHTGKSTESSCIDTIGKMTDCHLLDSSMHVVNSEMKKPESCNGCPYYDSYECNICGAHPIPNGECQFNYRFNQLMARLAKRYDLNQMIQQQHRR